MPYVYERTRREQEKRRKRKKHLCTAATVGIVVLICLAVVCAGWLWYERGNGKETLGRVISGNVEVERSGMVSDEIGGDSTAPSGNMGIDGNDTEEAEIRVA